MPCLWFKLGRLGTDLYPLPFSYLLIRIILRRRLLRENMSKKSEDYKGEPGPMTNDSLRADKLELPELDLDTGFLADLADRCRIDRLVTLNATAGACPQVVVPSSPRQDIPRAYKSNRDYFC